MNTINYSPYTFTDADIISGSVSMQNAMMFDTLSPDELTVDIVTTHTGNGKLYTVNMEWYHTVDNRGYVIADTDIRKFTYGTPLTYYYDGVLQGKFYVRSVDRLSKTHFRINAFSAVGLWTNIQHFGGIYNGYVAERVIEEVLNGKNLIYGRGTTGTSNNVTFTKGTGNEWTVNSNGAASAVSFRNLFSSQSSFPAGMKPGGTYYIYFNNGGSAVTLRVYTYKGSSTTQKANVSTTGSFTIPDDATGIIIRLDVASGKTVTNATVSGDIKAAPSNGFKYTIDSDVGQTPLYGYLPIASIRDNLQQILFVLGASLMKDANGDPYIKYLKNVPTTAVSSDRIYIGGKISYNSPATEVRVTEHSYYASAYDIEVSLFDNTDGSAAADHKLVTFAEPCHNLVATDLTIDESDVNYAYVTGTGSLTGKQYTHSTRMFSVPTDVVGEQNVAEVKNATLVSLVNSINVAARVSDYKSTAEEVNCGIVLSTDGIKPGSLLSFTDPYNDDTLGYVATMDITMSGKPKAECSVIKNYIPGHFGNNYTKRYVITAASGTLTFNHTGPVRLILIGGGQGGQGGSAGSEGEDEVGGSGGGAGAGGSAGKIYVVDTTVTTGDQFSYTTGSGGAGGAGGTTDGESGSTGSAGGNTTFGSYTSADGTVPSNGFLDIFSGTTYALSGAEGINGGSGGLGGPTEYGESVTYNGTTWTGGQGVRRTYAGSTPAEGDLSGAGGGGAAYGSNGGDAEQGVKAGDGANASAFTATAQRGSGGRGGNGGGGAGKAMLYWSGSSWVNYSSYQGSVGAGSSGSTGGQGIIIIYY